MQTCSLLLMSTLALGAEHASRERQQASPAGAPSGSLDASAKQADYSRTVCQFQVLGAPSGGLPTPMCRRKRFKGGIGGTKGLLW